MIMQIGFTSKEINSATAVGTKITEQSIFWKLWKSAKGENYMIELQLL